jgi:hypothetical protein
MAKYSADQWIYLDVDNSTPVRSSWIWGHTPVISTVTFYLTHQNLLVILSARGEIPGIRKAKIIKNNGLLLKFVEWY